MKKTHIILSLFLSSVLLWGSGCQKDFLSGLANNPNTPSQATPQLILTGALTTTASIVNGGTFQLEAMWMGYWNYSGNYGVKAPDKAYRMTTGSPQIWDNWYPNLTNYNYMEQLASATPHYQDFVAIAKIMKAFGFQYLVDEYNDVAYSKAFKGSADFFPSYDKGEAVYTSLVGQLDTAMTLIATTDPQAVNPQGSDVMFGGDMSMWAKFANTVKLRLLLRMSQVSSESSFITSEIGKTSSVGYLGLGEDALVNPGYNNSQTSNQNPMWRTYGLNPGGGLYADAYNFVRAGAYAMNFYKANNDPRLGYFYYTAGDDPTDPNFLKSVQTDTSKFQADYFGTTKPTPNSGTSGMGPGVLKGPGAPAVMMTASESLFLQAEAAYRGWISGDPGTLYDQAITASFEYLYSGISSKSQADADALTYYSQAKNDVNYAASSNKLEAILTQKWAALNGISNIECYADWRRTGFPAVMLTEEPTNTNTHLPYRFYYPQSEYNKNADAVKAEGTIDPFTNKPFWMP